MEDGKNGHHTEGRIRTDDQIVMKMLRGALHAPKDSYSLYLTELPRHNGMNLTPFILLRPLPDQIMGHPLL